MKQIDPASLIDVQDLADDNGIAMKSLPVYAGNDNFLGEAIYRPNTRILLHKDLANIVVAAADRMYRMRGMRFILTDGLRTIEAQERMLRAQKTLENPQWLEQQMLSKPGHGGHPRGMAVDIMLEHKDGRPVNMGTALDDMSPASARDYQDLPKDVLDSRKFLELFMREEAEKQNQKILPLPSEWWDFRLLPEVYEQYAPLSDDDLPDFMRMSL
ncbi:MAG TPA: M15 family metallopeptidase [Alphaproteobacteria bacterium]